MTKTDIECGHTKTTLYACGVNKGCKIIIYSHLNSGTVNDNFKDNFMQEKVNSILVVLILSFASFLFFHHRLGAFSNSYLMTFFTSLLVTTLVCNAASKLNYWDS